MWHNFYKIQDEILKEIKSKNLSLKNFSNLGKILKFLTIENLIKENIVDKVFFHNDHPPCFLENNTVKLIEKKIEDNFSESIPLSKITKKEITNENNNFIQFKVKNEEEYKNVFNVFIENSNFGKKYKAEKEEKRSIAEKNQKAHLESVNNIQIKKRKEFDLKSNLNVDFSHLRIACIDLEFFISKGNINKKREHEITELGIAYVSEHTKRNEHFLIREHYEKKRNREKQEMFNFGKTNILTEVQAKKYLDVFLKNIDILLFHENREDLLALKGIGVDIKKDYPNIQIIDTQLMYKRYFGEKKVGNIIGGESLDVLLDNFGVKYKKSILHNAGNDAEYTLQLLFAMKNKFENKFEPKVTDKIENAFKIIEEYAKEKGVSVLELINERYNKQEKKLSVKNKI